VNFVSAWQSQDDKYLTLETLVRLNNQLTAFNNKLSKADKKQQRIDLQTTYFARFHNLIRNEFQFEKQLIEERLRTWSVSRLRTEGFALFDMAPSSKGNLFQDKVIRFQNAYNAKLPNHQFNSGDSIKISVKGTDPLNSEGVDGIVLERASKYIDVCIKASAAAALDLNRYYRLDNYVNRVSYDRMFLALHHFLAPSTPETAHLTVSHAVRDLILYSYPNSMLRLANSEGGLRMALPDRTSNSMDEYDSKVLQCVLSTPEHASRTHFIVTRCGVGRAFLSAPSRPNYSSG
jgi:hypothetical protein